MLKGPNKPWEHHLQACHQHHSAELRRKPERLLKLILRNPNSAGVATNLRNRSLTYSYHQIKSFNQVFAYNLIPFSYRFIKTKELRMGRGTELRSCWSMSLHMSLMELLLLQQPPWLSSFFFLPLCCCFLFLYYISLSSFFLWTSSLSFIMNIYNVFDQFAEHAMFMVVGLVKRLLTAHLCLSCYFAS